MIRLLEIGRGIEGRVSRKRLDRRLLIFIIRPSIQFLSSQCLNVSLPKFRCYVANVIVLRGGPSKKCLNHVGFYLVNGIRCLYKRFWQRAVSKKLRIRKDTFLSLIGIIWFFFWKVWYKQIYTDSFLKLELSLYYLDKPS